MQIHSALLRYNLKSPRVDELASRASTEALDYRRGLDEWFLRWKDLVGTLLGEESREVLLSWGQFGHSLALFLLSLLWPTPGGKMPILCGALAEAGLQLVQHQQLFARLYSRGQEETPPVVFPTSWAMSHAVLRMGLSTITDETLTSSDEAERSRPLGRCSSLLMLLEVDPDNLLTGLSVIFEELRNDQNKDL